MRLLFCCEFYYPSVGGVQEVMRQIAERMVQRGHDVTVATTRLAERKYSIHNGVKIVEFGVSGNLVRGIEGAVDQYRTFVASFECDAIMIKAAQQWTFDALWSVIDQISARKILIPCGFSGLYDPMYVRYFEDLPDILKKFDHLIFYADKYRDIDFVRRHQIENFTVLANGASETEFGVDCDTAFRVKNGIPEDSFVLLTVGSMTGVKGHRELIEAFVRLKSQRRHVTFIMNGNPPSKPLVMMTGKGDGNVRPANCEDSAEETKTYAPKLGLAARGTLVLKSEGIPGLIKRLVIRIKRNKVSKLYKLYKDVGVTGVRDSGIRVLANLIKDRKRIMRWMPGAVRAYADPMSYWVLQAQRKKNNKLLIISNYERKELVQAYMAADLFVFASNIEYSPLVLFESIAAGTPFLSVPVGNAEEIAIKTGGGIICPADKDERGFTRAKPQVLACEIAKAIKDPDRLRKLGEIGRAVWKENYTWDALTNQYERILQGDRH